MYYTITAGSAYKLICVNVKQSSLDIFCYISQSRNGWHGTVYIMTGLEDGSPRLVSRPTDSGAHSHSCLEGVRFFFIWGGAAGQ
jgi:hypothetical protein